MDSLLIDRWIGADDAARVHVLDEASVSAVRERVRHEGAALGLPENVTASLVNVASELAHNQLAHARASGSVAVRAIRRSGIDGLEIVAADAGPGIASPTDALLGKSSSAVADALGGRATASLGVGLAAVLELADECDFDVRLDEGTCVWARKFAAPIARGRQVGVFGRPISGEPASGDDAAFVRDDDALLVGLADGLGHGPEARKASALAVETMIARSRLSLDLVLADCDVALQKTRGAVMGMATTRDGVASAHTAAVGNIAIHLYGRGRPQRSMGSAFVLGAPRSRAPRKTRVETHSFEPRDVLVLFSDGLSTRVDLESELDLLREHPLVVAHQLLARWVRDNDDALVLVVS
jgi:anti-sigma regulatory factor (Ser/Thr protein kinase)